MFDGSYHIVDFDESSKPTFKSKVIFENSDTSFDYKDSKDNSSDLEDEYFDEIYRKIDRDDVDFDSSFSSDFEEESFRCNSKGKKYGKNDISDWVIDEFVMKSYRGKPNTFKWTFIGIIFSILILLIGFKKSLLIFVVILASNIVGQYFDGNSRLMRLIEIMVRKLR
ncbi:DUF2273 domain-containing protein [Peptostreptococcus sp. D1]|uniref:DUF2273 domain-containing protein n=1 Tax=Peptostreptococcus sp. D1 TaxID=72304 RepID=UPI0008EDC69F|nr:DUF2273 domain-containing protein [Peptostreptococcus sp. D1]SFE53301.1 Small integral membrane protein [Peptostreptococcus sp. D1]